MVHTIYVSTCYVRLSMFERKWFNSRLFVSAQNKQKLWFTHKPQNWFSKQFYLTSAIANTKQTLICLFSEVRTSMTSYKGIHVCLLVRVKATRGTRNTLSLYRVAHDVLCGTVWKFNLVIHTEIRDSNFFLSWLHNSLHHFFFFFFIRDFANLHEFNIFNHRTMVIM